MLGKDFGHQRWNPSSCYVILLPVSVATVVVVLCVGQCVAMLVFLEAGYRLGRRHHPETPHKGLGTIEAAVFALLGLLLGFAFSGSMARLDARRQLIIREANAIGTAYLRIDLLPSSAQPEMRRLFRTYLEARLRAYESLAAEGAAEPALAQASTLQQRIWGHAVESSRQDPTQTTARIVLPALNEMIDVTMARTVAWRTRLPTLIVALLLGVALFSALIAGYAMAERTRRSPLHVLSFAVIVSLTIYTVLDLDNPRVGLIRLDTTEQILKQLHDSIR